MSNNKESVLAIVLLVNSFIWYHFMLLTARVFLAIAICHVGIIGFSVFGSILSGKINRVRFIYLWIVLGAIISFLPIFVNNNSQHTLAYFIIGGCFGIGLPSCLSYFADHTSVSKRGSLSGVIFLATYLGIYVAAIFGSNRLIADFIFLSAWRVFGLIVLLLVRPVERADAEREVLPFAAILKERPYMLYFITWLVFCVTESGASIGFEQTSYIAWIGILGALASIFGGIVCDRSGRKRVLFTALIALGMVYAIRGIFPNVALTEILHLAFSGISWGAFSVIFILVLWGDLSHPRKRREKYYALGVVPFFLFVLFRVILIQHSVLVPDASLYSLASFSLFLSALSAIFAPETLPEKKIELRRLRRYVERAKKVQEEWD